MREIYKLELKTTCLGLKVSLNNDRYYSGISINVKG